MPPDRTSSQARLLAPVALVAFALAVALIVLSSGGTGDSSEGGQSTRGKRTTTTTTTATERARERRPPPTHYTVKPGDTLGRIGEKTGTDVDILQQLNPSLDPQALVAGQKIKLPPK